MLLELKKMLKAILIQESTKDVWVDGQDVMLKFKISSRTLQRHRDNGLLPYSKLGGKIVYRMGDIERILDENSIGGFNLPQE
ncbi:MAG: helix-turn-helix domain-containing protein [Calditrichaeota bacterium]|nr:helix-turn-helix domain-containing protein [Calditrichota bacterium]